MQWAACNGIRDRAAYIKRKDLATAQAVDHDYNYLTSIERQLDIAERHAESRGIIIHEEQGKVRGHVHKPVKGEIPLQAALQQNRVIVDKAPKGMSRQKQNKTHWDRRAKRVVWTVEWVHKNGSRELGSCPENELLDAAYRKLRTSRSSATEAQSRNSGIPRKRRKMDAEAAPNPATGDAEHVPTSPAVRAALQDPQKRPALDMTSSPPYMEQLPSQELNFYLLLPSTPTAYRVLIPLQSKQPLSAVLTDRFVLEYPTIYALKQTPERLPTGFITEKEYVHQMVEKGQGQHRLAELLEDSSGWRRDDFQDASNSNFDKSALEDVVKRDLISLVDTG
ncbi:MAG: hypothetical protein Q9174_001942 [Haloplaca sp. 1 TL-2023]